MRTNACLGKLVRRWQKILHLRDWNVSVSFARHFAMGSMRAGEITYIVDKKRACISVLDERDWNPAFLEPQDIEKTVVHELVHLHLATKETGLPSSVEEPAVEGLARAFVSLYRLWPKPENKEDRA